MKAQEGSLFRRRALSIIWGIVGLWLLVALLSYDPSDNAWSHMNTSIDTQNSAGIAGAYAADMLLLAIGRVAYLIPVLCWLNAVVVLQVHHYVGPFFRAVGGMFFVAVLTILASNNWVIVSPNMDNAAGGLIGLQLIKAAEFWAQPWLINVIMLVVMMLLFTLTFSVRWLVVVEWLGTLPHFFSQLFESGIVDEKDKSVQSGSVIHELKQAQFGLLQSENQSRDMREQQLNLQAMNSMTPPDRQSRQQPVFNLDSDQLFDQALLHVGGVEAMNAAGHYVSSEEDVFTRALQAFDPVATQPSLASANNVVKTTRKQNDGFLFGDEELASAASRSNTKQAKPYSQAMRTHAKREALSDLPGLDLLDQPDALKVSLTTEQLARMSELLAIKLKEFNIVADVKHTQQGPVVTRFELALAPGVKASKVTSIARDLARSMSMPSVRVVEVIPGKPYIGIEVPNAKREMVRLIELLNTKQYDDPKSHISMAMGKDIAGNPIVTDLAKAPHMLVAGTTGSGKSVAVNAMLLSMLLKYTPAQLRLILIDPKQLELSNYNDIPHLLTPVVTDMKDATSALNWCVGEMERRYKLLSLLKVRNLEAFNHKVMQAEARGEDLLDPLWKAEDSALQTKPPRLKPLPLVVVIADEFADMIMQVGKKAEDLIQRLAQKARAAGIHLVLATQRPSVDVITGLIKANIPTRVALRVNSKIDSRTILDEGGAEYLLGHGDMLFLAPGKNEPERVHGAFISDDEVNRVCDAWRERGAPEYVDEILTPFDTESDSLDGGDTGLSDKDPMYDQVVAFILETRKVSASAIQRKFSLGYNRAARIVDQMEAAGLISQMGANGKRDILF